MTIAIEVSCVSVLYLLHGQQNIKSEGWYFRPYNWGNRKPIRVNSVGLKHFVGHWVEDGYWLHHCSGTVEVARVKSPLLRWLFPHFAIKGVLLRRYPAVRWRFLTISEIKKEGLL